MKKTLFLTVTLMFIGNMIGYSHELTAEQRNFINNSNSEYIGFMNKLKSCTPSNFEFGGTTIKINGIKGGMCNYSQKSPGTTIGLVTTGERIDTSNCNYNVPVGEVAKYAENAIKLTKAIHEIGGYKLSETELKSLLAESFNYTKKYCK